MGDPKKKYDHREEHERAKRQADRGKELSRNDLEHTKGGIDRSRFVLAKKLKK